MRLVLSQSSTLSNEITPVLNGWAMLLAPSLFSPSGWDWGSPVSPRSSVFMCGLFVLSASFLTMSSGMKHQLDGFIRAHLPGSEVSGLEGWYWRHVPKRLQSVRFLQAQVYGSAFGVIVLVATANPQGFLLVGALAPAAPHQRGSRASAVLD